MSKTILMQADVLDKGFVELLSVMGTDQTAVDSARISTGGFNKTPSEKDIQLLNYLMANEHATPFEQIEYRFRVKAPIFVFREWHRHRTAHINEESGRYKELKREYYIPSVFRLQSTNNKQSSYGKLDSDIEKFLIKSYTKSCEDSFDRYNTFLRSGMAREQARMLLPLSTYSSMVWKCDLRNLIHFLSLRMSDDAQWEIRQYANVIAEMVKQQTPKIWNAAERFIFPMREVSSLLDKIAIKDETRLDTLRRIINDSEKSNKTTKKQYNTNESITTT